ncbi:HAD hydrolase family protein [Collinsella tanakaei]|uniref:HAD hydrolase family protein n=1 Tax=Collinsella tanakaei TaxID=626935 RepID=UPI0025A348A8|nr:HAD family hydrolase [Collinsella tanakaei]MDM8300785.1 HAD family hydrolase [Collinsella tanakaei]
MIKLFASDLDGTLLNAFHKVDRTITDAIREVTDAGAHVVLATGRTLLSGSEIGFGDLPVEVCGANGAIIAGRTGVLKTFTVRPELLELLIPAFPGICFECISLDGMFASASAELREAGFAADPPWRRVALRGMRRLQAQSIQFNVPLAQILEHEICKVNCRVADAGLAAELKAFIAEHADLVVNAPFSPVMFEMTDPAVNKGASIAWLARHLGVREDEVAVYGDGGNDIAMLERFEHAYATANGSAAAKRAAGNVIGRCAFHAVPRHMVATVRERHRGSSHTIIE